MLGLDGAIAACLDEAVLALDGRVRWHAGVGGFVATAAGASECDVAPVSPASSMEIGTSPPPVVFAGITRLLST